MDGLVIEGSIDVVIFRDRFESDQLAEGGERLDSRQLGGGHVVLELQQLQLDLDGVAFAEGAGADLVFAEIDGLLETG